MLQKAHPHGSRRRLSRHLVALLLLAVLAPQGADGQKMPWRDQPIGQKFAGVEPHWPNMDFDWWPWKTVPLTDYTTGSGYLQNSSPQLQMGRQRRSLQNRSELILQIERNGELLASVYPMPEEEMEGAVGPVDPNDPNATPRNTARKKSSASSPTGTVGMDTFDETASAVGQSGSDDGMQPLTQAETQIIAQTPSQRPFYVAPQAPAVQRAYQGNTPMAQPEDFIYLFNDQADGDRAVIGIPFEMPYLNQPRAVTPPSEAIYQQVKP